MPAALKLHLHDPPEALWQAFRDSTCAVERRRIQMVALLAEGRTKAEVCAITQYRDSAYCEMMTRYNTSGLAGLRDQRHFNSGAPTLLSDAQILLLAQVIRKDYAKEIVWNGNKVCEWIKKEFGIEVYPGRAYEFLSQIGFSVQSPRPRHIHSGVEVQDNFKKNSNHSPTSGSKSI